MEKLYCPRCGYANNPKSRFCKHCGFNLVRYKQRIKANQSAQRPLAARSMYHHTYQSQASMNYGYQSHSKQKHYGIIIILVIVVLVILSFIGIGAYNNNTWPFGTGPVSQLINRQSNNNTDNADNYTPIKTFWNHINNRLDSSNSTGGSSSIDYLFQGNSDNYTLSGLKDWLHFVEESNSTNDITVTSITPYDFSSNNGIIHYKVRYNFDDHAKDYNHIQIYSWHAKVHNGKIVSMSSPKRPLEDYNE